jgi:hydroxymethylbilane synthase
MAVAAMEILGITDRIAEVLDVESCVPAPGQGCVAVECRADDSATIAALAAIDHPASRRAVEIERAFLARLGSGCSLPVGAHCTGADLWAFLQGPRGAHSVRIDLPAPADAAAAAAADLATQLHRELG